MLHGVVVKAYNSFYYVQSEKLLLSCKVRGRFKKERFTLMVGDEVRCSLTGHNEGLIEEILPRRSLLKRPAVANVDQVVITFAAANPDISTTLVDKLLVLAESSHLSALLCINKSDLADSEEPSRIIPIYTAIGYPVLLTSVKTGQGMAELRQRLIGRVTAFAGPSGAGKSSLLNAVEPGLTLVTGEVSAKIGRGRHTTRYAQLLPLSGGGFVVDTPGFSATEFTELDPTGLGLCFPEIAGLAGGCKFSTCLHDREPQCAVKDAVQTGGVELSRYESYKAILQELRDTKKGY